MIFLNSLRWCVYLYRWSFYSCPHKSWKSWKLRKYVFQNCAWDLPSACTYIQLEFLIALCQTNPRLADIFFQIVSSVLNFFQVVWDGRVHVCMYIGRICVGPNQSQKSKSFSKIFFFQNCVQHSPKWSELLEHMYVYGQNFYSSPTKTRKARNLSNVLFFILFSKLSPAFS